MNRTDLEEWLERYRSAWKTDDPQQIGDLFTEDATYSPWPFSKAWEGRDAIVAKWIDRGDSKNPWRFESDVVAFEGDTGVVRGLTTYPAHDDEPEVASGLQQHLGGEACVGGARQLVQRVVDREAEAGVTPIAP